MKARSIKVVEREMKAVQRGDIAPGRVWVVTKREDDTVERRQMSAAAYQRARAEETRQANEALAARRKLKVSQDRFAEMLGISAATLRNWEQGRRQPSKAARMLLRVAAKHPKAVLAVA